MATAVLITVFAATAPAIPSNIIIKPAKYIEASPKFLLSLYKVLSNFIDLKGTGKEQSIRIESSSGLSKDEVERMRQDAEAHADEDRARRELIDLKNEADHLVRETEKQLAEHRDKLDEADVQAIEEARDELKKAAEGEDKAALEQAKADFLQKAQKLGEAVYKEQQAQAGAQPGAAPGGGAEGGDAGSGGPGSTGSTGSSGSSGGDEPVDADFEVKA